MIDRTDPTPHNDVDSMTGDEVEVDGVYANEAGREVTLRRGDKFPADLTLGRTTWTLKGFSLNEATIDHIQKENTWLREQDQGGR
ncbi:hypothetical protein [Gordoniibacillus kamchatkensis]|nr:hypothetical protein [Paenibacillus sp. VKM B-2647]